MIAYCMNVYVCVYIHTYAHTYMHTYYNCVKMHQYALAHIQVVDTYMHACIQTYTHAYVHACIHTYIQTCIHDASYMPAPKLHTQAENTIKDVCRH